MENKEKSMFQEARMKLKLTRNKVADLSDGFFNESRLEKIETGKLEIHPEEVVKLSEIYKDKELCSAFCATECPVGIKRGMKIVKEKNLSQIVLEMLATLQSWMKESTLNRNDSGWKKSMIRKSMILS